MFVIFKLKGEPHQRNSSISEILFGYYISGKLYVFIFICVTEKQAFQQQQMIKHLFHKNTQWYLNFNSNAKLEHLQVACLNSTLEIENIQKKRHV